MRHCQQCGKIVTWKDGCKEKHSPLKKFLITVPVLISAGAVILLVFILVVRITGFDPVDVGSSPTVPTTILFCEVIVCDMVYRIKEVKIK